MIVRLSSKAPPMVVGAKPEKKHTPTVILKSTQPIPNPGSLPRRMFSCAQCGCLVDYEQKDQFHYDHKGHSFEPKPYFANIRTPIRQDNGDVWWVLKLGAFSKSEQLPNGAI